MHFTDKIRIYLNLFITIKLFSILAFLTFRVQLNDKVVSITLLTWDV